MATKKETVNSILDKAGYKPTLVIFKNSQAKLLKAVKNHVAFYVFIDIPLTLDIGNIPISNISESQDCKYKDYNVGYEIAGLVYENDTYFCIAENGDNGLTKLKNHTTSITSGKDVFPMVNLSMVRDDYKTVDTFVDKAVKRIRNETVENCFDDIKKIIDILDTIKHKVEYSLDKSIEESYFRVQSSLEKGDHKLVTFINTLSKLYPHIERLYTLDNEVDTCISELKLI